MRIVFAGGGTGGHLYPGINIARALTALNPAAHPFFIGARRGVERDVLPGLGLDHELLDLHPLYRSRPWENWRTLVGTFSSLARVHRLFRILRPPLVVATGGYAAGAALAYATLRRVPFVLQEQNSYPGVTMRVFSRYAREIYLGFPEAAQRLRAGRNTVVVDTGNPIEPPPARRPNRAEARERWGLPPDGFVILAVGGSQGALALNQAVAAWVRKGLPEHHYLIWSTGRESYSRFRSAESANVRVRPYISPIANAYTATDIAVARAGAMTTGELCAWGIPAILVPLPTAAADHQTQNARALAEAGVAIHLPQSELSPARLEHEVLALTGSQELLTRLSAAAMRRGRRDAADSIARRILKLVGLEAQA